jgi:acyl-CoA thioesterase-1
MTSQLQARGIKVILLASLRAYAPASRRDPDGQHYDSEGHAAIAAGLLPKVVAAAGK